MMCFFMIHFVFRLRPPNRIVSTTPFSSLHFEYISPWLQVVGAKAEQFLSLQSSVGVSRDHQLTAAARCKIVCLQTSS